MDQIYHEYAQIGIQTWARRTQRREGNDESTELWWPRSKNCRIHEVENGFLTANDTILSNTVSWLRPLCRGPILQESQFKTLVFDEPDTL